jgi:predicted nuclease of predicted toxin-antitoxin system
VIKDFNNECGFLFYMDEHVPFAITTGLILRGVDVLTTQDDEHQMADDPILLDRAMMLERVIFTQDEDFLREAQRRQTTGKDFAGVIYAHQLNVTIGQCVADLELIAKVYEPEDMANRVEYLPIG